MEKVKQNNIEKGDLAEKGICLPAGTLGGGGGFGGH